MSVESLSDDSAGGTPEVPTPSALVAWPGWVGSSADVIALVVSLALAVCVALGVSPPGRPLLALVFFLAVPGWAAVRAVNARVCSLSAFAAIGLSVALTVTAGQVLVSQLHWAWRPTTVGFAVASAAALVTAWVRR
jgi:hypothetical protein